MEQNTKDHLLLPTVKTVGETVITYSVVKKDDTYALSVSSTGPFEGSAFVEDIARDRVTAEYIKNLFAENLVFPANVYEIFDDLLAK